jgi:hypothetical protein
MSDVNTVAESSPALPEVEPGTNSILTREMKQSWDKGNAPVIKPKAEPAPAQDPSATEASAEVEGESEKVETSTAPEAEKSQQVQKPKPRDNAETRKAQLNAEIRDLLKQRDQLRTEVRPKDEKPAAPSPAKVQPQYTRPKPTLEDKGEDGNPKFASYEDYIEELSDWKSEQRIAQTERARAEKEALTALSQKVNAAKERYTDFDEVIKPAFAAVTDPAVPEVVRALIGESDVFPDLLYTIGKPEELSKFVEMARTNPGKALRYIALTESLIHEELEAPAKTKVDDKPAEPEKTRAPKPPAEVGGRGSTPVDAEEAALKANDFRKLKSEWNRQELAKLKK